MQVGEPRSQWENRRTYRRFRLNPPLGPQNKRCLVKLSEKRKQDLPPGDKGKRKKHIGRKGSAIEPNFPEMED
ncbi:hypothetical protein H5410_050792 [Solanum commersonii]|uniref:Uncharacterized protein n=1 Tax=Solanum commersonii TaxID=4109 RepID=A0A9J5WY43_SOLCO|nr:hypothetical protein H5410_050792 [Solanum commersonii]